MAVGPFTDPMLAEATHQNFAPIVTLPIRQLPEGWSNYFAQVPHIRDTITSKR